MESPQMLDYQHPVSRHTLLLLIRTGLRIRHYRFARQAALAWLASFPGDLLINFYLAQALLGEGKTTQVIPILEDLCEKDPEFLPGWEMLASSRLSQDPEKRMLARASLAALGESVSTRISLPEWALLLQQARKSIQAGHMQEAEDLIQEAIHMDPPTSLAAVLHAWVTGKSADVDRLENVSNVYHSRWPNCLQISLLLADARLRQGDETGSVALLHQCVAYDAAGQVPTRIWGENHPYRPLWPERMDIYLNLAIPAEVAAELGWNQLPEGEILHTAEVNEENPSVENPEDLVSVETLDLIDAIDADPEPKIPESLRLNTSFISPETLRAIQEEFERLARRLRRPGVGRADGRFPIYVIFTNRSGLESQYGPQTTAVLDEEMRKLAETIRRRPNWGATVYYGDDPTCTAKYGLKPAPANDPWKLKLSIADLDAALAKKGEMIGALLIVGGPQIVPFHRLPNPTDDSDAEIFSDNPYTTRDENYFVPEWPTGRLPGTNTPDAGLLLTSLRKITAYHTRHTRPVPWWRRNRFLRQTVKTMKSAFGQAHSAYRMKPSFGYTAAVWKQSSVAVYRAIGEPQSMLISPPSITGSVLKSGLMPAQLTYFNLHGLPDSADWYGQKDPSDGSEGPDYPVALSPKDILNHGQAPRLVFSEACYGAYIENKNEEQSLALKFLSSGTLAVVGSTCISYGSVTTPLIAADLLGQYFWKQLRDGQTVGEAFLQAKVSLVQEMNRRQGYLDGEDQKTLISFVLYGDPLVTLDEINAKQKTFIRSTDIHTVKTICDNESEDVESEMLPTEILTQAKKIVEQYLPGYQDAELHYSQLTPACIVNSETLDGVQISTKVKKGMNEQQTRVTLSKQVKISRHIHRHYARITLDNRGKMIKLVVSR